MSALEPQLHPQLRASAAADARRSQFEEDDDGPTVGLIELLTWIGDSKRLVAFVTIAVALAALAVSFLMSPVFTARTTLLPPNNQQQSGNAAALAALGALGGLSGSLAAKTPDELYVALLKSDTVDRALADRYDLKTRYDVPNYEALRKVMGRYIHVSADKKSGLLTVEVDDEDPKFAAELANAHVSEITRLLGRLAVSEAAQRRLFFDQQMNQTKESLIKAEQDMQRVQEKSGVIVLDKQAESLINNAARLRAQIVEREVQLRVLMTGATSQNPAVVRLNSELAGLRAELSRMESSRAATTDANGNANAIDLPVGRLPEASIEYVRARRELKLQETLLESMVKQYEIAKLDEAKEGPVLQQVDVALPPDHKSRPQRALIVVAAAMAALLLTCLFVAIRRYVALSRVTNPESAAAWRALSRAWRWR